MTFEVDSELMQGNFVYSIDLNHEKNNGLKWMYVNTTKNQKQVLRHTFTLTQF